MPNQNFIKGDKFSLALMETLGLNHLRVQSISIDTPPTGVVVANIRAVLTVGDLIRLAELMNGIKRDA